MLMLIDRCQFCSYPIYWDDANQRKVYLCSCLEKNPDHVSDGCGEGMCIVEKKEDE